MYHSGFPCGSDGKEWLYLNAGARVSVPGWEIALEKGMAIHSSFLAWRIPWTEEPGRLQSTGSQRHRTEWLTLTFALCIMAWTDSLILKILVYIMQSRIWNARFSTHQQRLLFDYMLPACMLSRFSFFGLFGILWTIACQEPLSRGFSRSEYWSGLPCPP